MFSRGVNESESIQANYLTGIVGASPKLTELLGTYGNLKLMYENKEIDPRIFETTYDEISDALDNKGLPADSREALEHLRGDIENLQSAMEKVRETAIYLKKTFERK